MIERNELLAVLPPYKKKKILKVERQGVYDIIAEIESAHKLFSGDYDKISDGFWKGDVIATARNLFKFLKSNVIYSIEPDTHQSVKSPAAILATGRYGDGMNDCKHYSLFAAGVLDSLRRKGYPIEWCYRFANYKLFSREPGHVFVVVFYKGREYWLDAVLPTFNNKKSYVNKIDKKIPMALYQISGAGIGKKKRNPDGTKKVSKLKKAFLKVSGAVSRNAFLALVALNVKDMATKLYNKAKTNEAALKSKWENLGGNYSKLKNTFTKAAKKRAKKKGRTLTGYGGQQIGAFQLAAALAAAVPIIAALAKFLGKGGGDAVEEGAAVIDNIRDNLVNQQEQQQQVIQQQPPAYQQPPQPQPIYYAQAQLPPPPYYGQEQPQYAPQYAPQIMPVPEALPANYGIQVRPATIEGVPISGYYVRISGIGTANEVMEIKEVEPTGKKNSWLLPALVIGGGLLLANKKII